MVLYHLMRFKTSSDSGGYWSRNGSVWSRLGSEVTVINIWTI